MSTSSRRRGIVSGWESVWPAFEFRPLPGLFRGEVRRYADGKWLPDDGAHDLAFIGTRVDGWSCCLYVDLPEQRDIVWSWYSKHWSSLEPRHPLGNAWHYALRPGGVDWGGDWDRRQHPNILAGDSGMSVYSSERGCCNGDHIEFQCHDEHIAAGLLRYVETKEVFVPPSGLACMYCGDSLDDYLRKAPGGPMGSGRMEPRRPAAQSPMTPAVTRPATKGER